MEVIDTWNILRYMLAPESDPAAGAAATNSTALNERYYEKPYAEGSARYWCVCLLQCACDGVGCFGRILSERNKHGAWRIYKCHVSVCAAVYVFRVRV